jgi:hypothetical protein
MFIAPPDRVKEVPEAISIEPILLSPLPLVHIFTVPADWLKLPEPVATILPAMFTVPPPSIMKLDPDWLVILLPELFPIVVVPVVVLKRPLFVMEAPF